MSRNGQQLIASMCLVDRHPGPLSAGWDWITISTSEARGSSARCSLARKEYFRSHLRWFTAFPPFFFASQSCPVTARNRARNIQIPEDTASTAVRACKPSMNGWKQKERWFLVNGASLQTNGSGGKLKHHSSLCIYLRYFWLKATTSFA